MPVIIVEKSFIGIRKFYLSELICLTVEKNDYMQKIYIYIRLRICKKLFDYMPKLSLDKFFKH